MNGFHLSKKELMTLEIAHKDAKRTNASVAYKINAIILLGSGWTLKKVKEALLLDDETLRSYVKKYQEGGIETLIKTNYQGSSCRLSADEIALLSQELDNEIYLTTESVVFFVNKKFKQHYTLSGMRDLLHRLGYEYKKPKLVPGNPDIAAQEEFAEQYEEFIINKPNDAEILFVDAVHPEHNTMAAYGWIKRGETRELKTNSGRQRVNLHGAINAETHEVTIIESDTVNTESTINLLEAVRQKYFMASMVYIILDNARYHYSHQVRDYLKGKNIKLVFLPSYSPNLNLIERLWKFFKKKVLYNTYYEDVKIFRKACIKFFRNIDRHSDEVKRFMNSDFHISCNT